jgi:uncharacterized protein (DUF1697 family)
MSWRSIQKRNIRKENTMDDKSSAYVLLLRGVNVGGKNKVPMVKLRELLTKEGFSNVSTYINSGNILLDSSENAEIIKARVRTLIDRNFSKNISMLLLDGRDYLKEASLLPKWWNKAMARKDVLFLTDEADPSKVRQRIEQIPLFNEIVSFGNRVVFWGKCTEKEYSKTAYHRLLLKEAFYPHITIRNGRTFDKIAEMLEERILQGGAHLI